MLIELKCNEQLGRDDWKSWMRRSWWPFRADVVFWSSLLVQSNSSHLEDESRLLTLTLLPRWSERGQKPWRERDHYKLNQQKNYQDNAPGTHI